MKKQLALGLLSIGLAVLAKSPCIVSAQADEPDKTEKESANLIPNESFEEASGQKPAGWDTQQWGGKGEFAYATIGRTGKRCVMISSEEGADIGWHATVPVQPHSSYRLTGWIKTENVTTATPDGRPGRGALLNLHNIQPSATEAVTGTKDWTKVELMFDTGGQVEVQVNCLFGGWGLATGKAWYDDIRLEAVNLKDWKPSIAIDAAKKGHPISKYIYGQFIEHLGRCIYGGIWAEMLEDRKFFDPVGAEGSPWKAIGEATVAMESEDSFVGEHTPKVTAPGGIAQSGLGLVEGKKYVGRIWLKVTDAAAPIRVSLVWGTEADDRQSVTVQQIDTKYVEVPLSFTAGAGTDDGRLEIAAAGTGTFYVGTVSLMPADNVHGMRADTLRLLEELDSPVYRWPGGNFVSGYDWRDGIGPRDRRPPRKNPAWKGIEHNDFGLDDFMTFCRVLGTEPYIAVNSGLAGVENAVGEVQYANGAPDSPMGKLRAKNGHPEPYKVNWWGIGNEMYGGWQLGHMPLEDYIKKHNVFADAMRAEDPSITLVAVGATGKWSEGMMQFCADHMELISEHFYRQGHTGLASHVRQIPDAVRQKAEAHRDYRRRFDSLKGKDIDIALDEWNYWYGPHVYGELGTRYFLKDALGIAAGLNEYARQSDIMFMANYAQTVNVIGCIKTSKTAASFATTGLALKLYRKHFGVTPVAVTTELPLDVAASLTEDGRTLTVAVVNPTMRELELPLTISGAALAGAGQRWEIAGDDPMAYNEPGKPAKVTIQQSTVTGASDKLTVAPCSVTLFALALK
ncbi:MAG: alpha-L-arabinofuranosidase [Pirellulaceae bacterium]|nr:alpha-L-arabinofuranosidase [Pirellulaceae bacterium]